MRGAKVERYAPWFAQGLHVEPGEGAAARHGEPGDGDVVAPLRVGHLALGPGRDPAGGPPDLARHPRHDDFLGVVEDLAAESAAHVGGDHPQLALGNPEREGGEQQPDRVRVLAGGPDRHLLGRRVPLRRGGAGFHRRGDEALVHELDLHDLVGLGEGLVTGLLVPERPVVGDVVLDLGVDEGRTLIHGAARIDHGRKRLVVHLDRLDRVGGDVGILRDHHGHRIPHVADAVGHHDRPVRNLGVRHQPAAGKRTAAAVLEVLAGEDGQHAVHGARRRGVHPGDPGVGLGAALDRHVHHARKLDVGDVASLALDEAGGSSTRFTEVPT